MKKKIIRYLITAGVGLVIALSVSFVKSLYWLEDITDIMQALSDCFVVPGLFLILFGLLVVCSNGGTFDMLGFGTKKVISVFKRHPSEKDRESFYEYRNRKQEGKRSFGYLIIVGVVFLAIGMIFFVLCYNV